MSMTSSGQTAAQGNEFRLGNVFNRTMGVLSRNAVRFILLAAVAQVPLFLITLNTGARNAAAMNPRVLGAMGMGWIVYAIASSITQTIICYAAFQDMSGRPVRLGDSLGLALNRFFPLLGLGICWFFAITVGMILLIVPGLIWATMMAVSGIVCIVERRGPFSSIGRSSELTKGNRWRIFGIFILVWIAGASIGGLNATFGAIPGTTIAGLMSLAIQSAFGAFSHVLSVVIYHDLRVVKEGVDTSRIAAVFD